MSRWSCSRACIYTFSNPVNKLLELQQVSRTVLAPLVLFFLLRYMALSAPLCNSRPLHTYIYTYRYTYIHTYIHTHTYLRLSFVFFSLDYKDLPRAQRVYDEYSSFLRTVFAFLAFLGFLACLLISPHFFFSEKEERRKNEHIFILRTYMAVLGPF